MVFASSKRPGEGSKVARFEAYADADTRKPTPVEGFPPTLGKQGLGAIDRWYMQGA